MEHRSAAVCLLLLGTLCSQAAMAQQEQPSAQEKAAAIALADKGLEHYEAGRYTEALTAFGEAEQKIHAPTFLLMVARCYVQMGRLVDAHAAYQRIVEEKLGRSAPPEFVAAQADAKSEIATLQSRIPTVEIVGAGTLPEALELTLDERAIFLSVPVPRDPGDHTLVVRAPGYHPLTKTIRLVVGAKERIEISRAAFIPLSTAEQPKTGRVPSPSVSGLSAPSLSSVSIPPLDNVRTAVLVGGWIAAGSGLAAGVVFTLLANGRAGDAEGLRQELIAESNGYAQCPDLNPLKCAELKDTVLTKVDLSNAAFWSFVAGGAIGAGTLVYGLVTMRPTESRPIVQVVPLLGTGASGLLVNGTF